MTSGTKTSIVVVSAFAMGLLILDAKTALAGATEGLEICIRTVIPSLFPFFVLSTLLTGNLLGTNIRLLRPLGKICGIPNGAESVLLVGFLGGYPTGAQAVCEAWRSGGLSKNDAQRMLGFCNNAGPAFLFGMGATLFDNQALLWIIWIVQIVSALLTSALLPDRSAVKVTLPSTRSITLTHALERSMKVMATVCGWIILFRVIRHVLNRWILWILPPLLQISLSGLLELSGGCIDLLSVENPAFRFMMYSTMLSCGGICIFMQTLSATEGLDIRQYLLGKCLQTGICMILNTFACIWIYSSVSLLWILFGVLLICVPLMVQLSQKNNSRNLDLAVV